jgi:hypothetical protein
MSEQKNNGLKSIDFYAEIVAENIPDEELEFYLYSNGEYGIRTIGTLSDNEDKIVYKTDFSEEYWGTIIEDDHHGVNLNKKERTQIEKDIIIRFTKEDLSYTMDPKTGQRLFQ